MLFNTTKSYCNNLEDVVKFLLSPKLTVTLTNVEILNYTSLAS